jgi:uncharacterized protein involved in exopolysaccharide biosynthesis
MKKDDLQNKPAQEQVVTINETAQKLKYWSGYVISRWKMIMIITLVCVLLAMAYAFLKPPGYIAESTFALEENESTGALNQYAGLAAMAGISLNPNSNGLFAGDNILELYKSRTMLKKTLLSKGDFNGKNQLLIDRYIEFNHLRDKWSGKDRLKNLSFDSDTSKLSILQDSIIFDIVKKLKKKNLSVGKPDKKLSVVYVTVQSRDELFAREFDQKLVENVNAFYIATRTAKASKNLAILQQQTDSVHRLITTYMTGAAMANDFIPNANPNKSILHTASQKKLIDMQASTAVYAELLKNLELAKVTLRKETPLIQIIDQPDLPLEKEQPLKVVCLIVGAFAGLFISVFYILFRAVFGFDS